MIGLSGNGLSISSMYHAFFHGQCGIRGGKELAKVRAPPLQVLRLLALLGRCWTSDCLQRHGLQNNGPCALCLQASEAIQHLLLGCLYSREGWFHLLQSVGLQRFFPAPDAGLADWWLPACKQLRRKRFKSLVILVWWLLWRERNDRVFNNGGRLAVALVSSIHSSLQMWVAAGFLSSPV
jgi:hypothetical protein